MGDHPGERKHPGELVGSNITSSSLKNGLSRWAGNQARVTGGLHGWARSSRLYSGMKGTHTSGGSTVRLPRKNTKSQNHGKAAQGHVQLEFEHLQGQTFHSLSGQPFPVFIHLKSIITVRQLCHIFKYLKMLYLINSYIFSEECFSW